MATKKVLPTWQLPSPQHVLLFLYFFCYRLRRLWVSLPGKLCCFFPILRVLRISKELCNIHHRPVLVQVLVDFKVIKCLIWWNFCFRYGIWIPRLPYLQLPRLEVLCALRYLTKRIRVAKRLLSITKQMQGNMWSICFYVIKRQKTLLMVISSMRLPFNTS